MKAKNKVVRFIGIAAFALFVTAPFSGNNPALAQEASIPTEGISTAQPGSTDMSFLPPIVVSALVLSFAKGMAEKLSK